MEISKRLQLKKPQITDDIQNTIQNLSDNFETIDNNFDETVSDITAFLTKGRLYDSGKKFWNRIPSLDGFIGWTNIRTGVFAPSWGRQTSYNAGDIVTMGKNDGHYYQCIVGGTSGVNEPFFSLTAESITEDLNGVTTWTEGYSYKLDDIVVAKNGDKSFYFKCIQEGTSRSVEPNWTNISGSTVIDGTVGWYAYKTIQWKERGASCEFAPFGRVNSTTINNRIITDTFTQTIASSEWILGHNMGKYPQVTVIDLSGEHVIGKVDYLDSNTMKLTFSEPLAGRCYLS